MSQQNYASKNKQTKEKTRKAQKIALFQKKNVFHRTKYDWETARFVPMLIPLLNAKLRAVFNQQYEVLTLIYLCLFSIN